MKNCNKYTITSETVVIEDMTQIENFVRNEFDHIKDNEEVEIKTASRLVVGKKKKFDPLKTLTENDYHIMHYRGLDGTDYVFFALGSLAHTNDVDFMSSEVSVKDTTKCYHFKSFLDANNAMTELCDGLADKRKNVLFSYVLDARLSGLDSYTTSSVFKLAA